MTQPVSIALSRAYLCVNCDAINDSAVRCGHCPGTNLMPLADKLGELGVAETTRLIPWEPRLFRNGIEVKQTATSPDGRRQVRRMEVKVAR